MQSKLPFVTVIMPVRNEARWIATSLGSVLAQDYPPTRMEILVADGRSTDETRRIVGDLRSRHPNVRLIDNPRGIVPNGFNLALQQAAGDFIVRVDGHTEIATDYVRQCVEDLQRTGASNVGGRMRAVGAGPFGRAVAAATSSRFGVGGARFHYSDKEEWVDTVYLGAWPKAIFHEIGPFDEEMVRNQDDEFNCRLRAMGGRILLSPRIRSSYVVRGTPGSLWRQYFQYGYWKVRVLQKHPRQMRLRQFAPPVYVLVMLGSLAAGLVGPWGWWPAVGLSGAYLLANVVASIHVARRAGWRVLPRLPLTYVAIHWAYGAGFLAGLASFWNRWERAPHRRSARPASGTEERGSGEELAE